MSQSAVSHALKRLRELFGDELFVRSKDGMSPTPKAVEISDNIHEIIRLTRSTLIPSQAFDPKNSNRTINLALGNVGDLAMLPGILQYIRENEFDLKVRSWPYSAEDAIPLLGDGKLDLYVGLLNSTSYDIMSQKLYEDRLVVIASSKHRLDKKISTDDYVGAEHFAAVSRAKALAMTSIENLFESHGVKRNIRIATPHIACLPGILERDEQLIATIPNSLAAYYKENYAIKSLEPEFELPKVEIYQYWHRRYANDPFILWLRRTMRSLFQNNEKPFHPPA